MHIYCSLSGILLKMDELGERIPLIDSETGEQKLGPRNTKRWEREDVQGWSSIELFVEWRKNWAEACNSFIVPKGVESIDHRSYRDRGLDIEPTIHEGIAAREIETRGGESWKCEKNREIMEKRSLLDRAVELWQLVKDWFSGRKKDLEGDVGNDGVERYDKRVNDSEPGYREILACDFEPDERRKYEAFFREYEIERGNLADEFRKADFERDADEIEGRIEVGRVDRG